MDLDLSGLLLSLYRPLAPQFPVRLTVFACSSFSMTHWRKYLNLWEFLLFLQAKCFKFLTKQLKSSFKIKVDCLGKLNKYKDQKGLFPGFSRIFRTNRTWKKQSCPGTANLGIALQSRFVLFCLKQTRERQPLFYRAISLILQ